MTGSAGECMDRFMDGLLKGWSVGGMRNKDNNNFQTHVAARVPIHCIN